MDTGRKFSCTFAKPGTYSYFCSVHPKMTGKVVVRVSATDDRESYDIKSVLLAKHAQHVVLIHFPIALCPAAVAFDYLAQRTKNRALQRRHSI